MDKYNIVGLGFDGAANMAGKFKGVQARFKNDVPTAQYVHFRAHNLTLAILHACQEPVVRNMYAIVSQVVVFIGASAKRLDVYFQNNSASDHLKGFCATRWPCHEETLRTFLANFANVVETLDVLSKDSDTDTSSKAASFKNSILEFQLIITLITVHCYLTFTKPLSLIHGAA